MNRLSYIYFYNKGMVLPCIPFFSEKDVSPYACFSQWCKSDFMHEDKLFTSMEQYMMAMKAALFGDVDIYNQIMKEDSPSKIKKMGRLVKGFDQSVWDAEKYRIVLQGNILKFSQNDALKEILLSTGNKLLIEASPYDPIWGVHMSADNPNIEDPNCWEGENLLGFALMEARNIIKLCK